LARYTSVDDVRFQELREFEHYIRTWGEQVENLDDSSKAKMTLSPQTVTGIYMTINGFIGAMSYLLSIGAKFVNARVFCQDPIEQYFSKQRGYGGGLNNVSADTFFSNESKISIHRDLNVGRKSGNTLGHMTAMTVDETPRAKRKRFELPVIPFSSLDRS